ncbi:RagB/SusD family nutrient uptake outer membrane protein [Pinibacter soli]|uniref:RagB/SusD family nutrient uptake outer membrane protein n=1 Tax=Pinibacter soli TaxID=3044211 RepID=A0ABT6RGD3_9BACT|nr:RagB/SusD family nutrient uptake outer membrane protein [Pinibacter soli]MDI3320912.1 RagB/SusD family nutrient uptake outer membrane protein [Pinibacter soli]
MNKHIKYSLWTAAFASMITLGSCKKFLDYNSPSALNIEQTFANPDNTNNELLSVYNKAAGRSAFGANLSFIIPAGGDDFSSQGASSFDPANNYAIPNFGVSSMAGSLYDTYTALYAGIERANIAIKYIPKSSGFSSNKTIMQRYLGEALTLRALFYYELIINWGDVPATFVPSADLTNQFIPNSDRDSTYDKILADLKQAEDYVGWRSELSDYGSYRITKAAVKGIRARIALACGGYALHDDKMVRKADYQKYYQIAMDECRDIIKSGEHGLNPVYENIFKTLHTPTRYDDAREIIFEIAMWGGMNDSDLARSFGTWFNTSPTWGKSGGGPTALPTYFYAFQNGTDARRDVTVSTYTVNGLDQKVCNGLVGLNCGKFRKSWTTFTASSTLLTFGVNWPVIRYADILMMYAEAANELQTFTELSPADALAMVQKRAYGSNPLPVVPKDKDGFFNALVQERMLEFGGEGLRKYDLIRWNLLGTKIAETKAKLPYLCLGAPMDNNPYPYASDHVWQLAAPFTNKDCTTEESSIQYYGGNNNVAFYTYSTASPAGYARVYWRRQVGSWANGVLTAPYINDPNQGYACKFEANRAELLPYPQKVMIENRGAIKQNKGYN